MGKGRSVVSRSQIFQIGLIVLAAAGVAWLSLATYLPRALPNAQWLRDDRPARVFAQAGQQLVANKGRLDEAAFGQLADAVRRDPLASEPLLFAGMRALDAGDLPGAERLLVEARARNPRNRLARIALMALYLLTGRVGEGSSELAVLASLEPRGNQLLVSQLIRLTASPRARAALVDAVGDQPIMADFLAALVRDGADPALVLSLARRQPANQGGTFAEWQRLLLARLVDGGNIAGAYELWSGLVGGGRREPIYDADFSGDPGPPPFNWELTVSDVGAAEQARGGGLDIEYFGRKSGALARQLLLLRPGRHRLQFEADGSANGQGSRIEVRLACRAGGANLVTIPLRGLTAAPRAASADFTVPGGCDSQWLTFTGEAAEFPTVQRAHIAGLQLISAPR